MSVITHTAIPVREFLRFKTEDLVFGLKQSNLVLFDDGVKVVHAHEVTVNVFFWKLVDDINNIYKTQLPITRKLDVKEYYSNGYFVSGTLKSMIKHVFEMLNEHYTFVYNKRDIIHDFLLPRIADMYNDIYNDIIQNVKEYGNSLFIRDILDIQFHPEILKSIKRVTKDKTSKAIESAYDKIHEVIRLPQYKDNIIAKGVVSGVYNKGQINQVFGPIGFGSELNGMVFKELIPSSYTIGLLRSYDIAVVSRIAARSLYFSSKAIENSEYLGRLTQLIAMEVENLVDGDCGNTDYLEWKLDEDSPTGKNELELLAGKFYLDPETGTEKMIKKSDKHLIGKIIKIRTTLTCKHKHTKSICVRCFGGLSSNVPYTSNIGHVCSASISRELSQGILSTKHQTDSSNSIPINLDKNCDGYIIKTEDNFLYFHKNFYNKSFGKRILVVPQHSVKELFNITPDINLINISPNKLTSLDTVELLEISKKGVMSSRKLTFSSSKIKSKSKKKIYGYFTMSFIQFILENPDRLKLNTLEDAEIDISDWDNKVPFLEYPKLEYNLTDLTDEVKNLIRTESGYIESPYLFLQDFFNLVNSKLNINIALIELMTLALCVSVKEDGTTDYHLARNQDNITLSKLSENMYNGSLGGSLGYERHDDFLMTPLTLNGANNVDRALDCLIAQKEVYEAKEKGLRN